MVSALVFLAICITTSIGHAASTKCRAQKPASGVSASPVDQGSPVESSTPSPGNFSIGNTFLYAISSSDIPANPTGADGQSITADVYSVDLFDTSTDNVKRYTDEGKKVLCYFSAGSYEDWRDDKADFLPQCYCNSGSECALDPRWQGEWWLDLHSEQCVENVQKVMAARIAIAVEKRCYGIDPDNTDSYTQKLDYGTTEQDQFDYFTFLSKTARDAGLAITLKNSGDLLQKRKDEMLPLLDGAIIEQCLEYGECASYSPFITDQKPAWVMAYDAKIKCDSSTTGMQLLQYDDSQDLAYTKLESTLQC